IRAEAVPDIGETLELLGVPGSVLEGPQLVAVQLALAAARLVGAELGRLVAVAPRTVLLRATPVPKDIEPRLRASLDPEGELLDLTELWRPHTVVIAAAWEMCIAFDDLCARARYAVLVNGFAPDIGAGPLVIRNGRHPLLTPWPPLDDVERGNGGEVPGEV